MITKMMGNSFKCKESNIECKEFQYFTTCKRVLFKYILINGDYTHIYLCVHTNMYVRVCVFC